MAGVDYLDSLKQYAAGGGKDIGEFLRQHTQPTQTTPGPTVPSATAPAAPVATPAVQPASPVAPATPPPAPMVNPSVNVVRAAFQQQDATPSAGAVASFPRPAPTEARGPINNRYLYPPAADQGRILGTNGAGPTVVQPATPSMMSTRPAPPPTTAPAPAAKAPTPPVVAPARSMVDGEKDDPYRFRLPSERKSGQDFITKEPISTTVPPPDRNLAANTVEDDSPPGAAPYSSGPLAMPKPSPPPNPGGRRSDAGAVASLPRRRNQRRMEVAPSKLFGGEALAA